MKASMLSLNCSRLLRWDQSPQTVRDTANLLTKSFTKGHQIPLLTGKDPNLDQSSAYRISAASCALAMRSGNTPIGRKIGFTNTKIWSEYNVSEPNWGYMWDKRTIKLDERKKDVLLAPKSMCFQPRIEPEIIFCLKSTPHSSMTEREALSCIEWISHGYEFVISLFKDWKFTAADTTATNALHYRMYLGKQRYLEEKDLDTLPAQLANFEIKLYRDKELVDTGRGSNVLGSPIKALLYLCRMLENQDLHPRLSVGEIITTGTLTKAMPIEFHQTWSTSIEGIDLPGLNTKIRPAPVKMRQVKNSDRVDLKKVTLET